MAFKVSGDSWSCQRRHDEEEEEGGSARENALCTVDRSKSPNPPNAAPD